MRAVLVLTLSLCACSKGGDSKTSDRGSGAKAHADDPYAAETWIAKLDDPAETERAVTELEHLCDPAAIPALGKTWQRVPSLRVLQVIVELARPLTPKQAEDAFCTDLRATGRPASWELAQPFLVAALTSFDATQRSIDMAVSAAEALGDARLPDAVPPLIDAVGRKLDPKDPGQRVRVSACAALGSYPDARAVSALADVIRADPSTQVPVVTGAAINALGAMHSADALPVLLDALFRAPMFFQQVQRALVGIGPEAGPPLRAILRGDDAAKIFYASMVLGSLYDVDAVPDLLAALQQPVAPAYVDSDGNPGPPAHNAILDALRKIGSPDAAQAVLDLFANPKTDAGVRAMAAMAYGFVSLRGEETYGGHTGLQVLAARASDNVEDEGLRLASAESLSRVATSLDDAKPLQALADKYAGAAAGMRKKHDEAHAKAYDDYAHVFEAQVASVELAARCAGDAACLMKAFDAAPGEVATAQVVRAVLELRRSGHAASAHVPALLEQIAKPAWLEDRRVRQAVLIALPKIAELPCDACKDALDALVEAGKGKPALDALSYETSLVAAYFTWAGR